MDPSSSPTMPSVPPPTLKGGRRRKSRKSRKGRKSRKSHRKSRR